ncbi:Fibroblast growth factor receptor 1-A [Halotydeus destructor]|nr:Fibroblast growth factor receptor 1-A [Halotydeus destructor]
MKCSKLLVILFVITIKLCSLLGSPAVGSDNTVSPVAVYVQHIEQPAGNKVRLYCETLKSSMKFVWRKDGILINQANAVGVEFKKRAVLFKSVTPSDSGIYTVDQVMSNGLESEICHFTLTVTDTQVASDEQTPLKLPLTDSEAKHGYPKFDMDKMDPYLAVIPSGRSHRFYCSYESESPSTVEWLKNGKPFRKDDRPHHEHTKTSKDEKGYFLYLENLVLGDSGEYTCVVENVEGSVRYTYKLQVASFKAAAPILLDGYPRNTTVTIGMNASLECLFDSDVEVTMEWFRLNLTDPEHQTPVQATFDSIDDPAILTFQNVSEADEGWYSCTVTNTYGATTRNVYLLVTPPDLGNPKVEPKIESVFRHNSVYWIAGGICFGFFTLACCCIMFGRSQSKHLIVDQNTYIVKKKVILEESDDKTLFPVIKFDSEGRPPLDNRSDSITKVITYYEMPLDPHWEISRHKLKLGAHLGEGAFGMVLKGEIHKLHGQPGSTYVAVKMLREGYSDGEMVNLVSELEVMKKIGKHPNIINLLGCCTQEGPLYVIVELAPHGNLRDYLRGHRPCSGYERAIGQEVKADSLSVRDLLQFAYQVASGMEYLSSKKCLHRDLAARNVLVAEDKTMKIADFGLARNIQDDYYRKTTDGRLPIKWMAPESINQFVYTSQSDVWSFGILLWEILTLGGTPYPNTPAAKIRMMLEDGKRMESPPRCPVSVYNLMKKTWEYEPLSRPTFHELVRNLANILTMMVDQEYLNFDALKLDTPPTSDDFEDDEFDKDDPRKDYKKALSYENQIIFDMPKVKFPDVINPLYFRTGLAVENQEYSNSFLGEYV